LFSPKLLLASAIAVALLGSTLAIFSLGVDARNEEKVVVGGGHGLGTYRTTGDVLDPIGADGRASAAEIDPVKYLRDFSYGRASVLDDGTTLREYTIIADDLQTVELSPGVYYNAWTFNGSIPGPTIRATEGDTVRIHFINNGTKQHSMHFHGIHSAEMDGVFEIIGPAGQFTYEFYAEPVGLHLYHCHVMPLEEHISHGLYGVYIVDPKTPRPEADEMVMVMNGYDTDFDTENNFYTVNGVPYYYMHHPIEIEKDRLVRIYLVNILEFDQINNFHLHGNLFNLYRTGTSMTPDEYTDMVTMSQGERAILEFNYRYSGQYMFHAHKTEFAEKGWTGMFYVKE
jgi:FtsP/CotA-like multicopper oxidase with cupredoxin domain